MNEAIFHGAETIEMNLEASLTATLFNNQILGPATKTVPKLVEDLLS